MASPEPPSTAANLCLVIHTSPNTSLPASLQKLLARGTPCAPHADLSESLCRFVGVQREQDWPIAALNAQAVAPDMDQGYWLRLDPVHLEVGLRGLFVRRAGDDFTVNATEANHLHALLRERLAEHALAYFPLETGGGLIHVQTLPHLVTTPLDQVENRQAMAFLPQGDDAAFWRRVLNDIQMALHDHPINQQREARGERSLNSVWLWGGGRARATRTASACTVWGGPGWLSLAATGWGAMAHPTATGLEQLTLDSRHWAGLDCHSPEDESALERHWFAPLLHALRQRRCKRVQIEVMGAASQCLTVSPRQAWQFWKNA